VSARVGRALIVAAASALGSLIALVPASRATAADCIPGHNTVVLPCTFDSGLISIDSATGPNGADLTGGGGGGHHTLVSFPYSSFGAGFQIEADIAGGRPPYSATDGGGTSVSPSITFKLTATSASAQINKLRFVLINPQVSGAGSITWTFGNGTPPGSVSGDQTITSGDLIFASPISTTTETLSATLSTGGAGSATVDGYAIYVPEPGRHAMVGAALVSLFVLKRRRGRGPC
jgi:hypothetical protein